MGQVPPKYMLPSAPYGGSQGTSVLNAAQPPGINPQTPLLPPGFTDPGTTVTGKAGAPGAPPSMTPPTGNPLNPGNPQAPKMGLQSFDPRRMFGL